MANPKVLERLRRGRTEWTQQEFAEKLGMSKSTYGRIINEESPLTLQTLQNAARLFNITTDELLAEEKLLSETIVNEPQPQYSTTQISATSVLVTLDGTQNTLRGWIKRLEAINGVL